MLWLALHSLYVVQVWTDLSPLTAKYTASTKLRTSLAFSNQLYEGSLHSSIRKDVESPGDNLPNKLSSSTSSIYESGYSSKVDLTSDATQGTLSGDKEAQDCVIQINMSESDSRVYEQLSSLGMQGFGSQLEDVYDSCA